MPENLHSKRDFSIFTKAIAGDGGLSDKLQRMYAMELYKTGDILDLMDACPYFLGSMRQRVRQINARALLLSCFGHIAGWEGRDFFKIAIKEMTDKPSSEIRAELGDYYSDAGDAKEAALWYYNAAYESEAILDVHAGSDRALEGLVASYEEVLAQELSEEERDYFMEALLQAEAGAGRNRGINGHRR